MTDCRPTRCVRGTFLDMSSCRASSTCAWCRGFARKSSTSSRPAHFSVSQWRPSEAQSRTFSMSPCEQRSSLCCRPLAASLCSTMRARQRTSSGTSKSPESERISGTTAPDSKKARMKVCSRNSRNVRKTFSCSGSSKSVGKVTENHAVSRMKKRWAWLENSSSMPAALLCPTYSRNSSSTCLRRCGAPESKAWMRCCIHCSPGACLCACSKVPRKRFGSGASSARLAFSVARE
mmetsp:Transcript_54862/g.175930  ORF Transcript_54862/g.175930 Transcript_54862/m.175930 type:complete len:234 (+) Transcript_54862:2441-3142(+)